MTIIGGAHQRIDAGDPAAQLRIAEQATTNTQQTLQMKLDQHAEVRMSTQMALNQGDDFADRTGGASQEDIGDVPYQMRPQIQHSQQLDLSRQEASTMKPLLTASQDKEGGGAVTHAEVIRKQSASQVGRMAVAQGLGEESMQQEPKELPSAPTLEHHRDAPMDAKGVAKDVDGGAGEMY